VGLWNGLLLILGALVLKHRKRILPLITELDRVDRDVRADEGSAGLDRRQKSSWLPPDYSTIVTAAPRFACRQRSSAASS